MMIFVDEKERLNFTKNIGEEQKVVSFVESYNSAPYVRILNSDIHTTVTNITTTEFTISSDPDYSNDVDVVVISID